VPAAASRDPVANAGAAAIVMVAFLSRAGGEAGQTEGTALTEKSLAWAVRLIARLPPAGHGQPVQVGLGVDRRGALLRDPRQPADHQRLRSQFPAYDPQTVSQALAGLAARVQASPAAPRGT
jgi:hypothetical protein